MTDGFDYGTSTPAAHTAAASPLPSPLVGRGLCARRGCNWAEA